MSKLTNYESAEDVAKGGCTVIIGLFVLALLALFFYNNATYRYCITTPDGRTSATYYTNAYTKRGDCLTFCEGNTHDSTQVCGVYRVRQINP
jgi:hypothetical protein